jgi:hypothetical protein
MLITTATALALGLLAARYLRFPTTKRPLEHFALAYLTGSAVLSLIVFAVAALGWSHSWTYLILLLAALTAVHVSKALPCPSIPSKRHFLLLLPFAAYTIFYLLHAAAPELSPDGSYYHLGFVELYHRTGRLVTLTDTFFNHMPQGAELLFLHAYTFGQHSAASLTHLTLLLALTALIFTYARNHLNLPTPAAALAAFAVFASPLIGWDATRAYVDVALAAAIFGMFYLLQLPTLTPKLAAAAGLLAGFAFSIKYMGGIALPLGALLILITPHTHRFQTLTAFSATALLTFAPWAIRNWITIGNPLSPFFTTWFPNPHVFPDFTRQLTHLMYNQFFPGWLMLPIEYTIRGCHTQGLLGPLFLLSPIALLLALRTQPGRRVALAAFVLLLLYPTAITRYIIPAAPFLALTLALALAKWPRTAIALMTFHAITAMPPVVDRYSGPYAMRFGRTPTLNEALRIVPEPVYLANQHAGYDVARMVDKHVPPNQTLYSFVSFPEAYSRTKALMYYTSARAMMATEIFFTPIDASPLFPNGQRMLSGLDPKLTPTCRLTYTFPPTTAASLRLVLTQSHPSFWTITDLHPTPTTAPEASRSPWYAHYAADNNPVTLWSTRLPAARNDSYTFQPPPEPLHRLTVSAPPDQCDTNAAARTARLEYQPTPNAPWQTLASQPQATYVPIEGDLRPQAACELASRGISYVLVNQGNLIADDIRNHTAQWNLQPVDQAENFILYSLHPCNSKPLRESPQ